MSFPFTDAKTLISSPDRGIVELGVPCDSAGFVGVSGVHYNRTFVDALLLGSLPLAASGSSGATYLSTIHGGIGSDARNISNGPPNVPAFPNPEVTGYSSTDPSPKTNGFINSEKIQRTPSDGSANNGNTWETTEGRNKLAYSLWVGDAAGTAQLYSLEVYRDLNVADKIAGRFGATLPALLNAQLVYSSGAVPGAFLNQNSPNLASPGLIPLMAGCNLYFLLRCLSSAVITNRVLGSVRLTV